MKDPVAQATNRCVAQNHIISASDDADAGSAVCVTCSKQMAYGASLERWQDECPCCFSKTFPSGFPDVGELLDEEMEPQRQHARKSTGSGAR
jgi:hypothetical protein